MAIPTPYFRVTRPFVDGGYVRTGDSAYMRDPRYASDARDLIRGYHYLEKDLLRVFEFMEPADSNLAGYSHQLYALLLRASTEFETNAKAILAANGYSQAGNWDIIDYHKVNTALRLSEYRVTIPIWAGNPKVIEPFTEWARGHSLSWYQHYNTVKHNRASQFSFATLENALAAVSAVFAIVFSQFNIDAFHPYHTVSWYSEDNGVMSHQECLLHIELPRSWSAHECYDFDWNALDKSAMPFQEFPF